MIFSLLQSFAEQAVRQAHLIPLLPLQEKRLTIRFGSEVCTLHLSQHGITVSAGEAEGDTLTVRNEADLLQLVGGEVRLQVLLRRRGLEYTGAYRMLLLVESLFYISYPFEKGA